MIAALFFLSPGLLIFFVENHPMRTTFVHLAMIYLIPVAVLAAEPSLNPPDAAKAFGSAKPTVAVDGFETLKKANDAQQALQNPAGAVKSKAHDAAGQQLQNSLPGSNLKSTAEAAGKANALKGAAENPAGLVDSSVDSAKSKAKKKAVGSALDSLK
jgi:hypothetical protein